MKKDLTNKFLILLLLSSPLAVNLTHAQEANLTENAPSSTLDTLCPFLDDSSEELTEADQAEEAIPVASKKLLKDGTQINNNDLSMDELDEQESEDLMAIPDEDIQASNETTKNINNTAKDLSATQESFVPELADDTLDTQDMDATASELEENIE